MSVLLHGLSLAAPELSDRRGLLRLFTVCDHDDLYDADYGGEPLLRAEESWLVKSHSEEPVAYVDLRFQPMNQESAGAAVLACLLRLLVHPDYRRRGLGTLLLRLAEERANRLAVALFSQRESGTPVSLLLWIPLLLKRDRRGALLFLEREGYAPLAFGCRAWPRAEAGTGGPDVLSLLSLPLRSCRPLLIYAKEIALARQALFSAAVAAARTL